MSCQVLLLFSATLLSVAFHSVVQASETSEPINDEAGILAPNLKPEAVQVENTYFPAVPIENETDINNLHESPQTDIYQNGANVSDLHESPELGNGKDEASTRKLHESLKISGDQDKAYIKDLHKSQEINYCQKGVHTNNSHESLSPKNVQDRTNMSNVHKIPKSGNALGRANISNLNESLKAGSNQNEATLNDFLGSPETEHDQTGANMSDSHDRPETDTPISQIRFAGTYDFAGLSDAFGTGDFSSNDERGIQSFRDDRTENGGRSRRMKRDGRQFETLNFVMDPNDQKNELDRHEAPKVVDQVLKTRSQGKEFASEINNNSIHHDGFGSDDENSRRGTNGKGGKSGRKSRRGRKSRGHKRGRNRGERRKSGSSEDIVGTNGIRADGSSTVYTPSKMDKMAVDKGETNLGQVIAETKREDKGVVAEQQ